MSKIRLTESQLHSVIKESIKKIINETDINKGEIHKELLGLNRRGLKKIEYSIGEPDF